MSKKFSHLARAPLTKCIVPNHLPQQFPPHFPSSLSPGIFECVVITGWVGGFQCTKARKCHLWKTFQFSLCTLSLAHRRKYDTVCVCVCRKLTRGEKPRQPIINWTLQHDSETTPYLIPLPYLCSTPLSVLWVHKAAAAKGKVFPKVVRAFRAGFC